MDVLGVAPVPHPSVPDLDLRLAAASFLLSLRLPRRRLLPFSACPGGAASSRSPPSVLPLRASRSRSPSPPRSLGHAAPVRRCGVGVPDSRPAPSRAADRGCACAHRREAVPAAAAGSIHDPRAGFNFSAVNRRKTGEFTVFGRYRKVVYRCFSVFFVSNFKISKKFINNRQKNRQKL